MVRFPVTIICPRVNEIGRQVRDKLAIFQFHVPAGKLRESRCNVIWALAHDSQKRWWHMAPTRCVRHAQPGGRPRNSRRWQLLYLMHAVALALAQTAVDWSNSLVTIYVVKLRLAFHTSSFPRFPVSRFPLSYFQLPMMTCAGNTTWLKVRVII